MEPEDSFFHPFHSRIDFQAAWARVKDNQGRAGSDGLSLGEFESTLSEQLRRLGKELQTTTYRPWPLLEIKVEEVIRDGAGGAILKRKRRNLRIPTVRDRVAQTAVAQIVAPWIEEQLETSSFGYRPGLGVRDAVNEIRKWFVQGYRYIVDADIDSFFDSVDHARLLTRFRNAIELPLRVELVKRFPVLHNAKLDETMHQFLQQLMGLFTLWVQAEVWDGKNLSWIRQGLPQGSVVSPLLANLFLDELDETLLGQGFKLVRYADDFVVLCKTPQQAQTALQITEQRLSQLHLRLNPTKTRLARFEDSFKFLGVFFWKDMLMQPLERRNRERHVLSLPPPLPPELAKRYKGRLK